jgi:hypothetical protein
MAVASSTGFVLGAAGAVAAGPGAGAPGAVVVAAGFPGSSTFPTFLAHDAKVNTDPKANASTNITIIVFLIVLLPPQVPDLTLN